MEQEKDWIQKELNMYLLMNIIDKRDQLLIEEFDREKKENIEKKKEIDKK